MKMGAEGRKDKLHPKPQLPESPEWLRSPASVCRLVDSCSARILAAAGCGGYQSTALRCIGG